uniref:Uncharacterized protein n=1 Tax=viral metagenome TaxID=1070528 RepID=A0A6C0E693_9ZZZZ
MYVTTNDLNIYNPIQKNYLGIDKVLEYREISNN